MGTWVHCTERTGKITFIIYPCNNEDVRSAAILWPLVVARDSCESFSSCHMTGPNTSYETCN